MARWWRRATRASSSLRRSIPRPARFCRWSISASRISFVLRYEEFPPSAALRPFVDCFWTNWSEGSAAPPDTGTVFPDGNVELVLDFGDGITRVAKGEARRMQRMVVGQMDSVTNVEYAGAVDLVAVRFRPAGAYAFMPVPLDDLAGSVVSLDDVARRIECSVRLEIDPSWPATTRIAAIESILVQLLDESDRRDLAIEEAGRLMEHLHGRVSMSELMRRFSLSARQLERRFLSRVGLPPKLLCRILRFRRASELLAARTAPLADVAIECGYFDQSHMNRDFAQFARTTPAQFSASMP